MERKGHFHSLHEYCRQSDARWDVCNLAKGNSIPRSSVTFGAVFGSALFDTSPDHARTGKLVNEYFSNVSELKLASNTYYFSPFRPISRHWKGKCKGSCADSLSLPMSSEKSWGGSGTFVRTD